MTTDYKLEFADVKSNTWRVWIRDTYVPPVPYGIDIVGLGPIDSSGGLEAAKIRYVIQHTGLPANVVGVTMYYDKIVHSLNHAPASNTFFDVSILTWGDVPRYQVILHRNGQPDEVINYRPDLVKTTANLKPATPPLLIRTVNSGDDKLNPVRATECVISYINEGGVSLDTFAENESNDNRWLVEVEVKSPQNSPFYTVFKGFLQLDDMAEPLLEPLNVVKLTATNKLGALKDVPLKNFGGGRYFGIAPIITYIAMALAATGLVLGIKMCATARLEGNGAAASYYITTPEAGKFFLEGDYANWFNVNAPMRVSVAAITYYITVTAAQYVNRPTEQQVWVDDGFGGGGFETQMVDRWVTEVTHAGDNISAADGAVAAFTKSTAGLNFFEAACLDSRTFDNNINESEDSYTVLSKLLGSKYYVTQHGGYWWILDVDNLQPNNSVRVYGWDGQYVGTQEKNNLRNIGRNEPLKLINADAQVQLVRPAKAAKVEYKYVGPENSLDNEKYNEGLYRSDEGGLPFGYSYPARDLYDSKISYANYVKKIFELNGWTLYKRNKTTGALSSPAIKAFIRRYYFEGVEKFRELGIEASNDWDTSYFLENNNRVPIEKNDKILLTFEMRWPTSILGAGNAKDVPVAQVLLYGDSGKVYSLVGGAKNQPYNQWFEVNAANPDRWFWGGQFSNLQQARGLVEWMIVKNDWLAVEDGNGTFSPAAPEAGYIKVRLVHYTAMYGNNNGDKKAQVLFRNISLQIKKYSGTNILLSTGQWSRVSQPGSFFKTEKKEIFIDNAPKRIFKGALLVQSGSANTGYGFDLAGRIIDSGKTYNSYGALLARSIWQQHNRVMRTVRATMAVDYTQNEIAPDVPGLIHAYRLEALPEKTFSLLAYEYNTANAVIDNCTLAEVAPVQAVEGELEESGFMQD